MKWCVLFVSADTHPPGDFHGDRTSVCNANTTLLFDASLYAREVLLLFNHDTVIIILDPLVAFVHHTTSMVCGVYLRLTFNKL